MSVLLVTSAGVVGVSNVHWATISPFWACACAQSMEMLASAAENLKKVRKTITLSLSKMRNSPEVPSPNAQRYAAGAASRPMPRRGQNWQELANPDLSCVVQPVNEISAKPV
jgi:hypothetical protein